MQVQFALVRRIHDPIWFRKNTELIPPKPRITQNFLCKSIGYGARYRPDIDGLRAVAVGLVVGFHAYPNLVPGGFVGVDIFFVISGFLITGIILQESHSQEFSFVRFYAKRVRRIFPALILVLLVCLVFGWFVFLPDEFSSLGKQIFAASAFYANFALLSDSGYFAPSSARNPLLHLWSLGIEEQFYLFWPLGLIVASKLRFNLFATILTLASASFVLNLLALGYSASWTFYFPLTRAWELLAGAALAWHAAQNERPGLAGTHATVPFRHSRHWTCCCYLWSSGFQNQRAVIGALLIAAAVLGFSKDTAFPGAWALLPVIGALLLLSTDGAWLNHRVLASSGMIFIGVISYPLYLWHWPLFTFASVLGADTDTAVRPIIICASIVLACITYSCIEKPIRFGRLSIKKVALLCLAMVVVGGSGLLVVWQNGLDFRLPDVIRNVGHARPDVVADWRVHTCLLDGPSSDENSRFASQCSEHGRHPLLFVWGDSFAGTLFPGLRAFQQSSNFGIAQFTIAGCPPIPSFVVATRPHCVANNNFVISVIRKQEPEIVLLHSIWAYPDFHPDDLDRTVSILRSGTSAPPRIVMLGPPPGWLGLGLPEAYKLYYEKSHRLDGLLPERTRFRLNEGVEQLDQVLAQKASALGIEYISAWNVFCDPRGCLTRVGTTDAADITTFDFGHLTVSASRYLIAKVGPLILPP